MASRPSVRVQTPIDGTLPAATPDVPTRDLAFVDRIRRGDAQAFEALFRTYLRPLYGIAYRYVGSRAIAEEVVQDVFQKVWIDRATWRPNASVEAFLVTMTRHRALNVLRRARVEDRFVDAGGRGVENAEAMIAGATIAPDEAIEHHQAVAAVRRAIDGLPPRVRLAATLRWQRGLSYSEIASAMGISAKTVEIHLSRAMVKLRGTLPGCLREE